MKPVLYIIVYTDQLQIKSFAACIIWVDITDKKGTKSQNMNDNFQDWMLYEKKRTHTLVNDTIL